MLFILPGKTVDTSSVLMVLQEAKELVKAFGNRSSHVPSAISVMDNIFNKLQPQVSWSKFKYRSHVRFLCCDLALNKYSELD